MFSFFLLCTVFASASSYCFRGREYVDFQLGFETEYSYWDNSEEAQFWWLDGETDSEGNCIEPWNTYSCDPDAWTTENHNATLFTCSEEDGDTPARCIDAALACNGMTDCPNGEDEEKGIAQARAEGDTYALLKLHTFTFNNCEEYECPYSDGGKCDHAWAEAETKLCFHAGWTCDGWEDCLEAEDEADC